jgi:thioredoxin reductase (NADPH)
VVFLASKVKRLHLVIRRGGLEDTMSKYLIDRISALPNVELHTHSEVVALDGSSAEGLTAATFRDVRTGATTAAPLRHLFLFIGADPNAAWLEKLAAVDAKGFLLTGGDCTHAMGDAQRAALPLETSVTGIFAIGDVRAGSTKRVAAAVGEGAAVVAQIHGALAVLRGQAQA